MMEISNPGSFPRVLGVTDPMTCSASAGPVVALDVREHDGVHHAEFQPAMCTMPATVAKCAGEQDKSYGSHSVERMADILTWVGSAPENMPRTIQVYEAVAAPGGETLVKVVVRIDADVAAAILASESEHGADYDHGFAITVRRLTDAVNELSQYSYSGATPFEARKAALQALAAQVGPEFVPAKPYDLWQWPQRAATVCNQVCGSTVKRDDDPDAEHKAVWYAAFQEDTLVIYPLLQPLRRSSVELITLDGVAVETPDWDDPAAAPATPPGHVWKVGGNPLLTAGDIAVKLFDNPERSGEPCFETTYGDVDTYTYEKHNLVVHQLLDVGYVISTQFAKEGGEATTVYFEALDAHL